MMAFLGAKLLFHNYFQTYPCGSVHLQSQIMCLQVAGGPEIGIFPGVGL